MDSVRQLQVGDLSYDLYMAKIEEDYNDESFNFTIVRVVLIVIVFLLVIAGTILLIIVLSQHGYFNSNISRSSSTITYRSTISGTPIKQIQCGISNIEPSIDGTELNKNNGRIINGLITVPNSWPWMVSIRNFKGSKLSGHFCGGSLITPEYVVTAAHCIYTYNKNELAVVIGLSKFDDSAIPVDNIYYVEDMMYHEKFDSKEIINDIALLKLSKKVTKESSFICLPFNSNSSVLYKKNVVTAGWGSTNGENSGSKLSKDLLQIVLLVRNGDKICDSTDGSYCATGRISHSNACYGDSGGPLMYWINGKWYLYGITSYIFATSSKCLVNLPSYYTAVPSYLDWIYNVLATLSAS